MTFAKYSHVVFKLYALLEHLMHFYLLLTVKTVLFLFFLCFWFVNKSGLFFIEELLSCSSLLLKNGNTLKNRGIYF